MQSILVPTDFSANATLALRHALNIAAEFKFEINLLHVYEMPLFERFLVEEEVNTLSETAKDDIFKRYLDKVVGDNENWQSVQLNCTIKEGNTTTEIDNFAKETEPLMVVTGSQGVGSDQWDRLILGGTAQKIIRRMNVPVMVVPIESDHKAITKIAYATDFSSEDMNILDELLAFAGHFKATVTAVHVKKDQWDVNEDYVQKLSTTFKEEIDNGKLVFTIVENDDVMQGLYQFNKDNDISLLALLKRYHNLWDRLVDRSMAIRIAMHTNIPTIVFKE